MPNGKPNILIIWGDDIGWYNISHNNRGAMGYRTPNIDRIAQEGIEFTDYYAQQSCTAGRAAFITGQNPIRTGLTKVGLPGAPTSACKPKTRPLPSCSSHKDTSPASLAKTIWATAISSCLPCMVLMSSMAIFTISTPRKNQNILIIPKTLHSTNALDRVVSCIVKPPMLMIPPIEPRFGRVGKQTIEDTGPLTRKRMETIDDDVTERAIEFIRKANAAGQPFFVWWNSTHMHFRTHIPEEADGLSGQGFYNDAMILHDMAVGKLLDLLDELGIAEDTIVQYSTDNGPHYNTWPDGAHHSLAQ